jgi:type II restriction enzyme
MKKLDVYSRLILNSEDDVFNFIIDNLKKSNRAYDYFINWNKVLSNVESIKVELNILNSLIGSSEIKNECLSLIMKYPEVIKAIPFLVAVRDKQLTILHSYNTSGFEYKHFNFLKFKKTLSTHEINEFVDFLDGCGILNLLQNKKIKNLLDYVTGTEVGLDTNRRKNRSGSMMENITEYFIKELCEKNNFRYLSQASSRKLKSEWNVHLPYEDSEKTLDFAIDNGRSIYLIETNYYGGGGSKLKSTAGEYQKMFNYFKRHGFHFVWVTDGLGWNTAKRPLRDSFNELDYILNLELLTRGALLEIVSSDL